MARRRQEKRYREGKKASLLIRCLDTGIWGEGQVYSGNCAHTFKIFLALGPRTVDRRVDNKENDHICYQITCRDKPYEPTTQPKQACKASIPWQ